MAQAGITSPFHFRLLFWQIGFLPDTVSVAVRASSRAEWIIAVYFFITPKFSFRREGWESCYQCFSKLESVCTEYAQLVASQFDCSRPGLCRVSGSGRVSVTSTAFCRDQRPQVRRRMAFAYGGLRSAVVPLAIPRDPVSLQR